MGFPSPEARPGTEQRAFASSKTASQFDTNTDSSSTSSLGFSSPAGRAAERLHSHPARKAQSRDTAPIAPPRPQATMIHIPRQLNLVHAPPMASGIHLVDPKQSLPERIQSIFPYTLFNAVQSKCFDSVYQSNDNLVVSAPTGSGKTAILELAICRLVSQRTNQNFKAVYMAPTKALCSERSRDWQGKLARLGLSCAELTGDTSMAETQKVGAAHIIVTTPEKWDSITRKWADHRKLLELVELFLIDEVHILKDARGATLEAVVCRMKTIGANVRFIALSATVPNSEDVARWFGRDHTNPHLPARRETFGEELRPVRLDKHVYGEHCGGNDWVFDTYLDKKIIPALSKHTRKQDPKPIMVFCFTRKSCETTAQRLSEAWSVAPAGTKLWPAPKKEISVKNKTLRDIVHTGVAVHHAGLDFGDRTTVERSYLNGDLHVICCTSTLAVGVNLPCHTVVLKGTMGYSDGRLSEYSDLEVMQMLGRAGRPQFDNSAVAIIFTRPENKARYADMVSGQQVLESTLHRNLIEHLNSEISLGTIKDSESARMWLNGTFLSIRLQRNPTYYQLDTRPGQISHAEGRLEEICDKDIRQLQEKKIVTSDAKFSCTPYGIAMSKYMVRFETMKKVLRIPRGAGIQELLASLSEADEFKDVRLKANERAFYRLTNESPFIRYPVKGPISETWQKVSLLIQSDLGGVEYPTQEGIQMAKNQHATDKCLVLDRIKPLVKCVIDCKGADHDAVGVRNALELFRSIKAGGWEGMPSQLLQVSGIGPVTMRKLVQHDILTMKDLAATAPERIQMFLSKNPPFGRNMLALVDKFPKLSLATEVVALPHQRHSSKDPPSINVKATFRYNCGGEPPTRANAIYLTFTAETTNGTLVYFWRGSSKSLSGPGGRTLEFSAPLSDASDHVFCSLNCEDYVGLGCSVAVNHKLPASTFAHMKMATTTPPPPRPRKSTPPKAISPLGEFDDSLDDGDLLEAAEQLDILESAASRHPPRALLEDSDDDEFPSIKRLVDREVESPTEALSHAESQAGIQLEPVQLPNGRWRCNHLCGGGGVTKTGKPCKHPCCKEGLEKRPKQPKPKSAEDGVPKRKQDQVEIPTGRVPSWPEFSRESQDGPSAAKRQRKGEENAYTSSSRPARPQVPPYRPPPVADMYRADVIDLSQDSPPLSLFSDDSFGDSDVVVVGSRALTPRQDENGSASMTVDLDFTGHDMFEAADYVPVRHPSKPLRSNAATRSPQPGSKTRESSMTRSRGNSAGPSANISIDAKKEKILREASELLDLPSSPRLVPWDSSGLNDGLGDSDGAPVSPGESSPSTLGSTTLTHTDTDRPRDASEEPAGNSCGPSGAGDSATGAASVKVDTEEPAWVRDFESENPAIMDLIRCDSITFV
ncbi:hypothetical protein RB598_007340 [Gaeumannomyces tritici]